MEIIVSIAAMPLVPSQQSRTKTAERKVEAAVSKAANASKALAVVVATTKEEKRIEQNRIN